MARAYRYIEPGQTYYVTHWCHDRSFLLQFARDRHAYRMALLQRARTYGIALFNYTHSG